MEVLREDVQFGSDQAFRLLRWSQSVSRVEIVLGPDRVARLQGHGHHWHYHRAMELTFVQRGNGTRFVADHIELFEPGDLVLLGTNVPHYWHLRKDSAGLSVQWDFPLEHGIWSLAEAKPLRDLDEVARHGLHLRGDTAASIRRIMEELPAKSGLDRVAAFLRILSELTNAPAPDARRLAERPFSVSGTTEHRESVARAVSYVILKYREQIRLPELLRLTGMSRSTFERQFHRHAGKSFSVFLNQVRLQAVCRALRDSTDLVGTIALNNGFNQLSFFNRLFRREFGMPPNEYRKQKRDAPRTRI
jgi:AraC-like DNA-binding protein